MNHFCAPKENTSTKKPMRVSVRECAGFESRSKAYALNGIVLAFVLLVCCLNVRADELVSDWGIKVLDEGGTRVCYVEASPQPDATVEAYRDVRLQATNRSLAGTDYVRVSKDYRLLGNFSPKDAIGVPSDAENGASIHAGYIPFGFDERWYNWTSIIEQFERAEWEGDPLVLQDEDGNTLAMYSLRGFTAIFDRLALACPEYSITSPEITASRPMISVSDFYLTADQASCFEIPEARETALGEPHDRSFEERYRGRAKRETTRCIQFAIEAPFLNANSTERLRVRAVVEAENYIRLAKEQQIPLQPHGGWLWNALYFDFFLNEDHVAFVPLDITDLSGVCVNPDTGRAGFAFKDRQGSLLAGFGSDSNFFIDRINDIPDAVPDIFLSCPGDALPWEQGDSFTACLCAPEYLSDEKGYYGSLSSLGSNMKELAAQGSIPEDEFAEMLDKLSRISNFAHWDPNRRLFLQKVASPSFEVTTITFSRRTEVYSAFQYIFARQVGAEHWTLVYSVHGQKWGFHTATLYGFLDPDILDIYLCVDDCSWHGNSERRRMDVGEWIESLKQKNH